MTVFFQAAAGVLLASILGLALHGKEISIVLTIAVCSMVVLLAVAFLEPVMDFLSQLEELSNLDSGLIAILLKAVAIGLVSEIAGMVCSDAGNASLGKAMQILGSSAILWLSIPIFTALLDLIELALGGI